MAGISISDALKVEFDRLFNEPVKPPEPLRTEPTDQGNQYVIPGCEHDRARGPNQMDLFK